MIEKNNADRVMEEFGSLDVNITSQIDRMLEDNMNNVPERSGTEFMARQGIAVDYVTRKNAQRLARKREYRLVSALFGGILLGASTVGICLIGPSVTSWSLDIISLMGCLAVSLGLILLSSDRV